MKTAGGCVHMPLSVQGRKTKQEIVLIGVARVAKRDEGGGQGIEEMGTWSGY